MQVDENYSYILKFNEIKYYIYSEIDSMALSLMLTLIP